MLIVEPGAFRTEFGGARMHRSREIGAYHVSTGGTRAAVDGMDGTQPGDPAKAAAAIRAHQDRLREELEAWTPVSTSTSF